MSRTIHDPRQGGLDLALRPEQYIAPADWQPPESLPDLQGIVAFDWETKDPGIGQQRGSSWPYKGEGHVCGLGLAWGDNTLYAPIYHAAGNMDPMLFWTWLRAQAAKPNVIFVMANSIYDSGWLSRHGITPANDPYDVQAMAYLLDEHRRNYSLNALGHAYLGRGKSTTQLRERARSVNVDDPMNNMDKLPAWMVAPYGTDDARLTLDLYRHLMPLIQEQGLERVHEIERGAAMCAVDMRQRGVRVDFPRAERLADAYRLKRDTAIKRVLDSTGVPCDPFESAQVVKALQAENSRVELGITDKGGTSANKSVLARIGSPVALAILAARRYDKAISTYIEGGILRFAREGRIHAEFHPTRRSDNQEDDVFASSDEDQGTTTGRFSSSNPNLQNIPIRDPEIGRDMRSCFLPEEGEDWGKLDWASQEPRITLHFAVRAKRRGAAEMLQRFLDNPKTDVHMECAQLMGVPRSPAKIINLALAYGKQGASLCRDLGLPTKWIKIRVGTPQEREIEVAGDEGQRLLDKHYEAVPYVKEIFELAKSTAIERGYIKTETGRRIRLETYPNGDYIRPYKALNGSVQGTAADQMKLALIGMRREGIPYNLTVHDEAGLSLPRGEEGVRRLTRAVEIMETCLPLAVPMIAEFKIGPSWGEVA